MLIRPGRGGELRRRGSLHRRYPCRSLPRFLRLQSPLFRIWADIAWLRSLTTLPLILKGILDPDDAEQAIGTGADAIVVSNHGSRNLDTLPATIDALPAIAERVAGRIPIILDGGVRRGTDVLKAISLGASAVMIGRPYVYALATAGAEGVAHCVSLLHRDFAAAMALTGRARIGEIDRSVIW
ncbi:alpha-hydroxy-acid oxidizing protein [Mesorhizobium amorphae]|uniref:alpha-hydroxy-acid oxidizing protein n=1 Tax=Mesorhizobium amorphae TaxID=71433 RepID=UPI0031F59027